MADFRAGHRNRSTLQLGDRTTPNKNNFVTIYGQSFKAKINNLPTNNQGIVAYYKKWERVQLQH